jgi:hypothetical protein
VQPRCAQAAAFRDLRALPGRAERERHEVAHVGHDELPKLRLRLHHHLPDEIGMARQQARRLHVGRERPRHSCIEIARARTHLLVL